ncbi:Uma2 family endonuclease, partial [Aphanizomenon flos-aquae]
SRICCCHIYLNYFLFFPSLKFTIFVPLLISNCCKLIVELLSPGTSGKDRGEKFRYYLTIPSLQEYILIDSEKISVERYCRGEGRLWLYYQYTIGDIITFSSIAFEFPIEMLYDGVGLETET